MSEANIVLNVMLSEFLDESGIGYEGGWWLNDSPRRCEALRLDAYVGLDLRG